MYQDRFKRSLIARLHVILDEAAHVQNVDNNRLVHEIVKEAVRYGGVVREEISQTVAQGPVSEKKGLPRRDAS
jgi:hypothetical protein